MLIEQILTDIFHDPQYEIFICYPYKSLFPNYDTYIPFKNCFLQIIARFYQNLKNHYDLNDENKIDYLVTPNLKAREPINQIFEFHEKQLNVPYIKQYVQQNSIEKVYEKYIQPYIPSNIRIEQYNYLDEIIGDLLNIGCNCMYFNAQCEAIYAIGQRLINLVAQKFKHFNFPSFYQFELGKVTINEIKFIIEDQQKNKQKSQQANSEQQLLTSTIMPQLQDQQEISSQIIDISTNNNQLRISDLKTGSKANEYLLELKEKLSKIRSDNIMYNQPDIPEKLKNKQIDLMTEEELKFSLNYIKDFML